jgi:hypothetical protein
MQYILPEFAGNMRECWGLGEFYALYPNNEHAGQKRSYMYEYGYYNQN